MTETGEQKDMTEWAMAYMREKAPEMLDLIAFSEVFDSSGGGAAKMCNDMGVPFLGKVPLDPQLCKAAEEGRSCFSDDKCRAFCTFSLIKFQTRFFPMKSTLNNVDDVYHLQDVEKLFLNISKFGRPELLGIAGAGDYLKSDNGLSVKHPNSCNCLR
ncbi:cytosolic Fe-S cluster assembly factor nbp35 [Datura stramonium]|uniref:Cytosolic Fe-S cluster assembly factor nbp35 n=1 Tax=Datura stramonium TaxID=4076 RepID=A0ABS8V5Y4_DATST|nr:cytosolic Fe-S cluster assembly factor nbp35 [Datura stramonium]